MNNLNFASHEVAGRDDRRELIDDRDSSNVSFAIDLDRYWHEAIGLKYWLAGLIRLPDRNPNHAIGHSVVPS